MQCTQIMLHSAYAHIGVTSVNVTSVNVTSVNVTSVNVTSVNVTSVNVTSGNGATPFEAFCELSCTRYSRFFGITTVNSGKNVIPEMAPVR